MDHDREDEKLMAMDQPITTDTDGEDLDALMIMSSAASEEGQTGQVHRETDLSFYLGKNQRLPDLGNNLGKNQGFLLPSKNLG